MSRIRVRVRVRIIVGLIATTGSVQFCTTPREHFHMYVKVRVRLGQG